MRHFFSFQLALLIRLFHSRSFENNMKYNLLMHKCMHTTKSQIVSNTFFAVGIQILFFFFLAKHRFVSPLFPLLMQITNVYYVFPKNSNFLKSDEEEKENV